MTDAEILDDVIVELREQLAAMTADRDRAHELLKERNGQCVARVAERDALKAQLTTVTAERDAAIRDKGYLSTAILQELPQELYLKVFDRYHKERGTYSKEEVTNES